MRTISMEVVDEWQLTEFFTINVEGLVSSAHYGKEIYVFDPSEEVESQLAEIFAPLRDYFVFGACGD